MLSENLYALRHKSGLSQEQLAEKIGVSRQAISKWETGASAPDLEKLRALSECFGVTLDQLAGAKPAGGGTDALPGGEEPAGPTPRADGSTPPGGTSRAETGPACAGMDAPQNERAKTGPGPALRAAGQSRLGVFLCAAGGVCLILFGLVSLASPPLAGEVSESSTVTLNGTGILIALCLLLMAAGLLLIFKKK